MVTLDFVKNDNGKYEASCNGFTGVLDVECEQVGNMTVNACLDGFREKTIAVNCSDILFCKLTLDDCVKVRIECDYMPTNAGYEIV